MNHIYYRYPKELDWLKLEPFISKSRHAEDSLLEGTCLGKEFLGWINHAGIYLTNPEFKKILDTAKKIQENSEVLVVIGIGGSYLGARAGIEFVNPKNPKTEVIFAGNNLSNDQLYDQLEYVKDKDFSINVISKSGTTTEPAIAFRFFKKLIEEKYGKEEAAKRIYATTDAHKGALKNLAEKEGYETFIVPDDIGGRYSVLTAVGLLPMAVAGLNVKKIIEGANNSTSSFADIRNYAAFRHYQLNDGKSIEILANFDPSLHYMGEWWKQLFAESEGKDGKGIIPYTVDYSTDLHSFGQMAQDGPRVFFETFLCVDYDSNREGLVVPDDPENVDGLNYLANKTIEYVNYSALTATVQAHENGGVPCSEIHISSRDEFCLGQLFYFFERACGISGNMLNVNPFNQPGVEEYKRNMFTLLGKPGYETTT